MQKKLTSSYRVWNRADGRRMVSHKTLDQRMAHTGQHEGIVQYRWRNYCNPSILTHTFHSRLSTVDGVTKLLKACHLLLHSGYECISFLILYCTVLLLSRKLRTKCIRSSKR